MIDGDVKAFVDGLYYGDETWFKYGDKHYFIQGWFKDGKHYLVLDYALDYGQYSNNPNDEYKYIWEYSSEDSSECVNAFLEAPLWGGKKFYDVEAEMTWTDPVY
ncbi:MAG: hypothetical protein IJ709_14490 [Selenomonas sp.]|nr:hypothetical protein [Selenomonas sp.]